jgi:HEAT repeat protein
MPRERVTAELRELLSGGDRRSIGRVPHVLRLLAADPQVFGPLVAALSDSDPLVRMRAADALEKATVREAAPLQPYKRILLRLAASSQQQEVRWHLAQLLPRLGLRAAQRRSAAHALRGYLDDRSAIVRTFALQGLADLASQDASLKPLARRSLRWAAQEGTPAMRARAKRLMRELELPRPAAATRAAGSKKKEIRR